jgi:hypothetical protein
MLGLIAAVVGEVTSGIVYALGKALALAGDRSQARIYAEFQKLLTYASQHG